MIKQNDELVDITTIKVNPKNSKEKKMKAYIEQIKNPSSFKHGEYEVNLRFSKTGKTLEDCILNCTKPL